MAGTVLDGCRVRRGDPGVLAGAGGARPRPAVPASLMDRRLAGDHGQGIGGPPEDCGRPSCGRCELVVPLGITGRGSRSVLRWLAGDSSDYNAPLASPELRAGFRPDDAAAFWRSIVDLAGPAAVLDLGRQPERIGGAANPFIAEGAGEEACRAHSLRLAAAAAASPLQALSQAPAGARARPWQGVLRHPPSG